MTVRVSHVTSHIIYKKSTHLAKESTLTIREAPEVEKDKSNPVNTTEPLNIRGGTIGLRSTMIPELRGQVLVELRQHQGNFMWEGEAPTQVN